jgi:hypothetical protein
MQKTKLTLALAAIGFAGFVASQQASAQVATANSGNSDLLALVVDTKTGETFYENLGVLALTSSGPSNLATGPINLATTGGTAWTTFVSNTGSDPLSYAVIGGGNRTGASDPYTIQFGGAAYPLNSYSTTIGGSGTAPQAPTNANLAQFNLIDQNIIGILNTPSGVTVASGNGYDASPSPGAGPLYTDASGLTSWNGKFGGVTDVAEGSLNDFYNFTQTKTATSTTASPSTPTLLGTFSLSGSTLTYTAAGSTAVPLPAAVWLLGSGLFGLVGIGRRRAA